MNPWAWFQLGRIYGMRGDIPRAQLASAEQQVLQYNFPAALRSAVTELQFQDMASQLIWHTTKVLQGCAFRLASEAMGNEDGEEAAPFAEMAPDRPNPVTQSEMDAGSVDLF